MDADQVNQAIRTAIEAVRAYRAERRSSLRLEDIRQAALEEEEIVESTRVLVRESFMLGPAGQPCPACGGTGRV